MHIYLKKYIYIPFSGYGKGNNGFYLGLAIGKYDVTERELLRNLRVLVRALVGE